MKRMRKCVGMWGEVRGGVGRCVMGGVGKCVWEMWGRCVEVCLGCGKVSEMC